MLGLNSHDLFSCLARQVLCVHLFLLTCSLCQPISSLSHSGLVQVHRVASSLCLYLVPRFYSVLDGSLLLLCCSSHVVVHFVVRLFPVLLSVCLFDCFFLCLWSVVVRHILFALLLWCVTWVKWPFKRCDEWSLRLVRYILIYSGNSQINSRRFRRGAAQHIDMPLFRFWKRYEHQALCDWGAEILPLNGRNLKHCLEQLGINVGG